MNDNFFVIIPNSQLLLNQTPCYLPFLLRNFRPFIYIDWYNTSM